jgi:hypothetical protein
MAIEVVQVWLAIYQKVASDEKLRMGCTLGYAITGDSSCLTKQDEISSVYQQHPRETNYQPSSRTPNPSSQEIDVISRSERRISHCPSDKTPVKKTQYRENVDLTEVLQLL